jgi:hypothetical protein
MWSRAKALAERTPETRNRYVDFLRAASITVVVLGHWWVAAAYVSDEGLQLADMLSLAPWTQWLTWALQVMPIFFIVGGYSNGISWEAARRDGKGYADWIGARLRRLVGPLVPLLITWSAIAVIAHRLGAHPEMIRIGSQAALIPTWFLAVYIMVAITAPATHWLFRRFGAASFWAFALGALAIDTVAFRADVSALRWFNYAFIWLGVHQLGYLWRAGKTGGAERAWLWIAGGLGALIVLVTVADYPISMITVPDDAVSNSRPPTFAMFALGILQAGLVLALEKPLRAWLQRLGPWAATVLVNATIMTLYLWHLTVMILVIGLAHLAGDVGLQLRPGSWSWWATRPLWMAIYAAGLAAVVPIFGRFEQTARKGAAASVPAWRAIAGAAGVCAGVALLALGGVGAEGVLGLRVVPVALVLGGAMLVIGSPWRRSAPAA